MGKVLRESRFQLGCLHGKLHAKDPKSEAHIQRTIFLSQRIKVWKKIDFAPIIRIFAYEVPLELANRGKSVDLMGYDKDFNLYLIELKKKESAEKMDKVINQLNEYETLVQQILPSIEKEFEGEFFYQIHFKAIKKMVIAPREFFKGKKHLLADDTIEYGHFRDKDITDRQPKQMINIHLEK